MLLDVDDGMIAINVGGKVSLWCSYKERLTASTRVMDCITSNIGEEVTGSRAELLSAVKHTILFGPIFLLQFQYFKCLFQLSAGFI
jgi:hypothetical protein